MSLRFLAGAMMLAMGLSLAGYGRPLRWAERAGQPVWRHVAPLARRLVPVRTPGHALALGLVWGFLPCGLVYAALAVSAFGGSALAGMGVMAAFGLGTLPTLIAMSSTAAAVARAARNGKVRAAAALVVACFGVLQVSAAGRSWRAASWNGAPECCDGHALPGAAAPTAPVPPSPHHR